jgi:hypothetical protein
MTLRDHEPIVLEDFNGLWVRGDPESVPSDHFMQADNIQYLHSGFETRDPIDKYQTTGQPIGKITRLYNYTMQTGQSILFLTEGGKIYHMVGNGPVVGPILTIPAMEDFGFVAYNGRGYITPFKTYVDAQGVNYELGLQNEFVYIYKGDGTPARRAAGIPPTGTPMVAALGAVTVGLKTDAGKHLIAVVYETDTGYLTSLGPEVYAELDFTGTHEIVVSNIPTSPFPYVTKRHLVSTKAILEYNGDQKGYQFFFIPDGNIDDNTTTTKTITYFDADLVSDASHLSDNFASIPAGVNLTIYHSRLVIVGEFGTPESLSRKPAARRLTTRSVMNAPDNRSVARLSVAGEPEAINKVDGIIVVPLDGMPLTHAQEIRDILYLFKKSHTYAYADDFNEPAEWKEEALDQAMGTSVHGIMTVLDAGGINVDYLVMADLSGLVLFNGTFSRPELSWKIEDLWKGIDKNAFRFVQLVNDPLTKKFWMTLPEPNRNVMLYADYGNGMDAKNIRWARWLFDVKVSSVCFLEPNKIIFGTLSNAN